MFQIGSAQESAEGNRSGGRQLGDERVGLTAQGALDFAGQVAANVIADLAEKGIETAAIFLLA